MDRLLEFKIVKYWENLKNLRNLQGFTSCKFGLKIILISTVDENVRCKLIYFHKS